jgi:hypothetical protein
MSIRDVNPLDLNKITGQTEDDVKNELIVGEDYNETRLIPYPSHDGYAIVNPAGGYFDKVVSYTAGDLDGPWVLDFGVVNTSPYCWSDYHFEFWNATFTDRLNLGPVGDVIFGWTNKIFQHSSFDGSTLKFWAPEWQCPGQTNQFTILVNDLTKMGGAAPGSFGIRQVATTIPEPLTMLGLFAGISALGGYLRRRRMP